MTIDLLASIRSVADSYMLSFWDIIPPFNSLESIDQGLCHALAPNFDYTDMGREIIEAISPPSVLSVENFCQYHYALVSLPEYPDHIYLVGPWTMGGLTDKARHRLENLFGNTKSQTVFRQYNTLYSYPKNEPLRIISTLVRLAYPKAVTGASLTLLSPEAFLKKACPAQAAPPADFLAHEMEQEQIRLEIEKEIRTSVLHGDVNAAMEYCLAIDRLELGNWTECPLRNMKNHLHTYNTFLRVSVENNDVHPHYTTAIFNRYARMIEELPKTRTLNSILFPMVQDYCACVRNCSLSQYSPHVKKVINQINLNLSSHLTLKKLASLCCISPGYLSFLFKKKPAKT